MLALPISKPYISKDAARAVHRVTGLNIQEVNSETLTTLLNLSGLRVSHFALETVEGDKFIHIFCDHEHDVAMCPRCGKVSVCGYDHQKRSVRHLDLFDLKTVIHFDSRRFDCEVCGEPFTELLNWIRSKRRQTIDFERHIYERVQSSSRLAVSLETGLNERTVLDIFKYWAKQTIQHQVRESIKVLGVDELSLRKGHLHYVLVVTDLTHRCVLDVLADRKKETLEKWLAETLTPAEQKAIKTVSMDMWKPYRQAVRSKLSHAQIVADRFHVMKQLNQQIDNIRRRIQKSATDPLSQILKKSRWVLLKDPASLTKKEQLKLAQILDACEELRIIYLLKEEFRTICNKIQDKAQAERFLRAWICKAIATGNCFLKRFVNTLENWWAEFLNYFDDKVTQGFVEGNNRAIRGIIARAFGFSNFHNFRLHVLVERGST